MWPPTEEETKGVPVLFFFFCLFFFLPNEKELLFGEKENRLIFFPKSFFANGADRYWAKSFFRFAFLISFYWKRKGRYSRAGQEKAKGVVGRGTGFFRLRPVATLADDERRVKMGRNLLLFNIPRLFSARRISYSVQRVVHNFVKKLHAPPGPCPKKLVRTFHKVLDIYWRKPRQCKFPFRTLYSDAYIARAFFYVPFPNFF